MNGGDKCKNGWTPICVQADKIQDRWTDRLSNFACMYSLTKFLFFLRYGLDFHQTTLENLDCENNPHLNILECLQGTTGSSFCSSDSADVYVECSEFKI